MKTKELLRILSIFLAALFLLLATISISQSAMNRAVSLKVLEERIKECMVKEKCSQNLFELCGLRKINGYVIDEKNNDVILIGKAETVLPPLYLEDLIIALRNVWGKYTIKKGDTLYYSDPGCSIDPDPNTLQRLLQIGERISSAPEEFEDFVQAWKDICDEPQQVKVFGVPFNSRFAKIMVDADYHMKKIVNGSDSLEIEGFQSLLDIEMNKAREDVAENRPLSISFLNRFWFFPGENSYFEEDGGILLKRCDVMLLTEEEFLSETGETIGSGQPNPSAQRFSEDFSSKYNQIAVLRPIYAELEALFRFVALATVMNEKEALLKAGLDLDYLLNQFPIRVTHVEKMLPGLSNVMSFGYTREYPGGYEITQLALPSCGGVSMDVRITDKNFTAGPQGEILRLKNIVLTSRPATDLLFWDFSYIE